MVLNSAFKALIVEGNYWMAAIVVTEVAGCLRSTVASNRLAEAAITVTSN